MTDTPIPFEMRVRLYPDPNARLDFKVTAADDGRTYENWDWRPYVNLRDAKICDDDPNYIEVFVLWEDGTEHTVRISRNMIDRLGGDIRLAVRIALLEAGFIRASP
jgi:hypothetical protein